MQLSSKLRSLTPVVAVNDLNVPLLLHCEHNDPFSDECSSTETADYGGIVFNTVLTL